MEYMALILKIQRNLEDYKRLVDVLSKEKIEDFSVVALKGTILCESMLELILVQKGYVVDRGCVILDEREHNNGRFRGPRRPTILGFCCMANADIVPRECCDFLNLIRNFRNQAAHVGNLDNEMISEFSKALDYFMAWFSRQHLDATSLGEDTYKKIKDRFFSLTDALDVKSVIEEEKQEDKIDILLKKS